MKARQAVKIIRNVFDGACYEWPLQKYTKKQYDIAFQYRQRRINRIIKRKSKGYKTDDVSQCEHENYRTVWERIPGEVVEQPSHDVCDDCGEVF